MSIAKKAKYSKQNIVILNIILEEIDRTTTARVKEFVEPLSLMKVYQEYEKQL